MVLTKMVENYSMPVEWKNIKGNETLALQIMKAIYSDTIRFTPVNENANICYWINDRKKAEKIFNEKKIKFAKSKKQIAIISCSNSYDIPFNDNIDVYCIHDRTITVLALGYFHFYLERFPYPEIIYRNNSRRNLALYSELLQMYTLSYVSRKTGLSEQEIIRIYKYFFMYKPHHHLIMKDDIDSNNIQSIRTISFLPLFQYTYNKEKCIVPLSFDSVCANICVDVKRQDVCGKIKKPSILDVEQISYYKEQLSCEKTSMKIYDIHFAEKFNVDPFPLYIN